MPRSPEFLLSNQWGINQAAIHGEELLMPFQQKSHAQQGSPYAPSAEQPDTSHYIPQLTPLAHQWRKLLFSSFQ